MVCMLAPDQRRASASGHLLRGKPDAEIPQLDEPGTVGPPEQAELLDRQKNKAPSRLLPVVSDMVLWSCGLTGVMRTEIGYPLVP